MTIALLAYSMNYWKKLSQGDKMSIYLENIKNELIDKLWLPAAKKCGILFYPRLKYKKMKVLTLTSYENFNEVELFIKNNLTEKNLIIGWNNSRLKCIRLETEGRIGKILGSTKYENSIHTDHELRGYFPFDIINLDFISQDLQEEQGRLEKEMFAVEMSIKWQALKMDGRSGYVLLFTTKLDSKDIARKIIIEHSNAIMPLNGWGGLHFNEFHETIRTHEEKINFINSFIEQIGTKYHFTVEMESLGQDYAMANNIYSLACILKRIESI